MNRSLRGGVESSHQCISILVRDLGTILWRVERKVPTLGILKWVNDTGALFNGWISKHYAI